VSGRTTEHEQHNAGERIQELERLLEGANRRADRWRGIAAEMGYEPRAHLNVRPTDKWLLDRIERFRAAACTLPAPANDSEAVGYMLREKSTGRVFWDEMCVWTHLPDAEEAAEEMDDHEVFSIYAHAPIPSTERAGNGQQDQVEAVARRAYAMRPIKVISQALAEVTGKPLGAELTWDDVVDGGGNHDGLLCTVGNVLAALDQPTGEQPGAGKPDAS
jgi:hypothetical protein